MGATNLPKSAVIIGAGIGGLATANLLAKAGVKVTVCEQHDSPGGRAGIYKQDGFTFDTGPSWYLMPEVFEHYFKLLGRNVGDHLNLVRLDPAYKVFFDYAEPLTIRANSDADMRTFDSLEPGAGESVKAYLHQAATTYDMAMRHFLYTNFDNPARLAHKDIVRTLPRLASMLATPVDRYVRRFVKSLQLQQILQYPMVFLGTSPYNAPAMYSLMSHLDFTQGVYYPKGGMYTIIQSLVNIGEQMAVAYRYNSPVKRISTIGAKATGVQLASGERLQADIVISNADLHFTETSLLPTSLQTYPESYWQKRTPSPSAVLMYLGVKGDLPQLTHHNLLFTKDWRRNFDDIYKRGKWPMPASMYISKTSATDTHVAPKGHENLFVLVPIPANDSSDHDIDSYANHYIDYMAKHTGIADLQSRIVTKRVVGPHYFTSHLNAWRGNSLGLAHTLPQSALFRPANASRKVRGLYYAGANTMPGIGLPMCLIGAQLVYKRLVGDTSAGPLQSVQGAKVAA